MLISQDAPCTLRSTSGEHHTIQGPNSRFPWAAASSGQTATAQSTPEAELVSLNAAIKSRGENVSDTILLGPYNQSGQLIRYTYGEHNPWVRPFYDGGPRKFESVLSAEMIHEDKKNRKAYS